MTISRTQVLIYMTSTLMHPHLPTHPEALMVHIVVNAIPSPHQIPSNPTLTFL